MAWVAVDKDGLECIFEKKPFRLRKQWMIPISFKNEEYCGFQNSLKVVSKTHRKRIILER